MHRIRRKAVLALVVVGALAAGGAAYTNSLTVDTAPVVGYTNTTVAGGELVDQSYMFDTNDNITGVTHVRR